MSGPIREALLVLTDGTVFEGEALGATPATGVATGEVVFNTVLSGYQEVISDPSYAGQIITFTYPHIGNYGVTPVDDEYRRPFCRGVVVREPPPGAVHHPEVRREEVEDLAAVLRFQEFLELIGREFVQDLLEMRRRERLPARGRGRRQPDGLGTAGRADRGKSR